METDKYYIIKKIASIIDKLSFAFIESQLQKLDRESTEMEFYDYLEEMNWINDVKMDNFRI
jgi:hypothetical protein